MSEQSKPQKKHEALDKQLVKLIGYPPTCLLAGAVISLIASFVIYLVQCFDFSQNFLNQLDAGYDHLLPRLKQLFFPSLLTGALIGLTLGVLRVKSKNLWQKMLINSAIGLLGYLLVSLIWKTIANASFFNALDYLRFFVLELSLAGILVGLLVALLPQSETTS